MADGYVDGKHLSRAKVYVRDVTRHMTGKWRESPDGPEILHFQEDVTFAFVNGNDPDSENSKFWEASPTSQPWTLCIANPQCHGLFQAGQEFYLDFVESVKQQT